MQIKEVLSVDLNVPKDNKTWLESLNRPIAIRFIGRDSSRTRVVVTLLHGNEPSGFIATHKLLMEDYKPFVDLVVVIVCVAAANYGLTFCHRTLPQERDINRCFYPPYEDAPGRLALALLKYLEQIKPEAIIDCHNTSGSGPGFGVSVHRSEFHKALLKNFTDSCIITDLRLGALMEQEIGCPIVTIEAGGARNDEAHELAYRGIMDFGNKDNLWQLDSDDIRLYEHPMRFEIVGSGLLQFSDSNSDDFAVTLRDDLEKVNWGITQKGHQLGWCHCEDLRYFRSDFGRHDQSLERYFQVSGGSIRTKVALQIFMATQSVAIAEQDCLFYFVPV